MIGLSPKEMPDHPDLVLYRMSAPDVWGLYLVRPWERAVFIENGKVTKVLEGGRHPVARMPVIGVVDVIWVAQKNLKLGYYADSLSRESVPVRMHGFAILKVSDVLKFVNNVVASQRVYTQEALNDWLRGQFTATVRSHVGRSSYEDYITERDKFIDMMRQETDRVMREYGLGITTVEVEKIDIDEDIIKVKKEKAKATDVAEVLKTKSGAVAQMYKSITDAGVSPTTLEFLKTMTGRDVSEVLVGLGTSPEEVISKMRVQAPAGTGILSSGSGAGPMDMVFTMFAMQMMQQMSGMPLGMVAGAQRPAVAVGGTHCIKCGSAMAVDAKFCASCGTAAAPGRFCPKCGAPAPADAKFCPGCGEKQS